MTYAERVNQCILKQTDPHFPWEMRRYGCRVMCLLAIPQYVSGRCLTDGQINKLIDAGRNTPDVITTDHMLAGREEHRLINWGFEVLGNNRHGRQVGWKPIHLDTVEWQYMIVHWDTAGADGHYTLHDKRGEMLYDPHDPMQAGYDIDFKGVRRQLLYATWEAA
jgi:hypothetical protein